MIVAATKILASEEDITNISSGSTLSLEAGWTIEAKSSARINSKGTVQVSVRPLDIKDNSVLQNFGTLAINGSAPIIVSESGELANYGKIDLSQVTNFSEYEGTIKTKNGATLVIPTGYTGGVVPKTEPVRFLFDVSGALGINYAGEGLGAVAMVNGSAIVITTNSGAAYESLIDIVSATGIQFAGNTGGISLKMIGEAGSSTMTLDNIFASPINAFENADKILDIDQTGIQENGGYGTSVNAYPKANLTISFGLKGVSKGLHVDPNDPAFQNLLFDGVDNSGFLSLLSISRGNLQVLSSAPKGGVTVWNGGVIAGYGATASNKAVTMEFGKEVITNYLSIPKYSTVTIKGTLMTGMAYSYL
jgi:hypothetical protein